MPNLVYLFVACAVELMQSSIPLQAAVQHLLLDHTAPHVRPPARSAVPVRPSCARYVTMMRGSDISSNNITSFPHGLFDRTTSLRTLFALLLLKPHWQHDHRYFFNNLIASVPNGFFGNLNQLQSLYMSGNLFTALPSGVFHGLSALTNLFVLNGMISARPRWAMQEHRQQHVV